MSTEDTSKKKAPAKKAATKKTVSKASSKKDSYVIAEGRALTMRGRVAGPGDPVSADDVADLEALVKGGFVVKA